MPSSLVRSLNQAFRRMERGTRLTSWFMSGAQIFGSLLLTQEGRFGRASWLWCKVQVLQSLEEAI